MTDGPGSTERQHADGRAASSRVRVYMACSLDGFIAGPDNDLSWLSAGEADEASLEPDPGVLEFEAFMREVGAMLMGRVTYDVVDSMGAWAYGETPVLVATHRGLQPKLPTVRAVSGSIGELVTAAKDAAGGKDVYLDGGALVRQALDAGLVDAMTLTIVPVLLGAGVRLFDDLGSRSQLRFTGRHVHPGGLVQVTAEVLQTSALGRG